MGVYVRPASLGDGVAVLSLLEDVGKVLDSARHLQDIVNAVLDIAKLDTETEPLADDHVKLDALLSDIAATFEPRAAEHGNVLKTELADEGNAAVVVDWRRLQTCLHPLVDNACRFTENGEVLVTAGRVSAVPGGGAPGAGRPEPLEWLEVTIRDTGIGIPPERIDEMFEPFTQADSSWTREHGGAGLGLAIASKTARLMGGEIKAISQPDQGSQFVVRIPLSPAKEG